MDKNEIRNVVASVIPVSKQESDTVKKMTVKDSFHIGGLSGNRLNSGTLRSQFIICEKETDWTNSDISAKKSLHRDQVVLVQVGDDIWDVYTGNNMSENEEPIKKYEHQTGLDNLLKIARKDIFDNEKKEVTKTKSSLDSALQKIYYGCPGSGKSHEVKRITNTSNTEGFSGLSSIERKQAYQKFLDNKHGHKKTYKGGGTNIDALTHPKLMEYISSCTEFEINSLFEISNEEDFNDIIEALKGCEAYQNDSITRGSGCHWETGLKSYGEFLKDQIPNTEPRKDAVFRTTFHPDTDYAAFVGCYKPCMNGGVIEYSYAPQVFTNAYIAAWENTKKPVYLVIEEINRGNCAQIFGDLFQLLDRDKATGKSEYPIKADRDLVAHIESVLGVNHEGIKNGELCLPPNLIIYATMNTSDQSLFPMDSAFKRRWDWEYVPIDYKTGDSATYTITIDNETYKWVEFLKVVNNEIRNLTHSEDKQMGNYFIKKSVNQDEFINKVMFYLWDEVCKEEYKTDRNFLRYRENSDAAEIEFSFTDLFTNEASKILKGFMLKLGVEPVSKESNSQQVEPTSEPISKPLFE